MPQAHAVEPQCAVPVGSIPGAGSLVNSS